MDKQQCYTRIEELERELYTESVLEPDFQVYVNLLFRNYHIENIEDLEDATIKELHRSINEL